MIFYQTDNYYFIIDSNFEKEHIANICNMIQERTGRIEEFLGLEPYTSTKKSKYIIKYHQNRVGHFAPNVIFCQTENLKNIDEPFIHEECHNIVYGTFGMLPCFIFEGLAEYIQFKFISDINDRVMFITDRIKAIAELEKKSLNLLTNQKKTDIPFLRNMFFYRAGMEFVKYLFEAYDVDYIHDIFTMFNQDQKKYLNMIMPLFHQWIDKLSRGECC